MSFVRRVGDHDFADVVLGAATPVVVGFGAASSPACATLEPALDELAAGAAWLAVALLDVDAAPGIAAAHQVASIPSVLAFSGGRLLVAIPGTPTTQTILRMLELALPRPCEESQK
jgi:thioredoxin 1